MTAWPQTPFVAQTPEQARLLLDLTYGPVLTAVMQAEAGAGEVAGHTGLTVKQAHHRLTRLLRAGLVVVTGERERSGRPIKLYRAAAQAYRVPFALTDAATMAELVGGMMRPFFEAYARSTAGLLGEGGACDVLICLDTHGHLGLNLTGSSGVDPPGNGGGYGVFTQLRLRREARGDLDRRLRELREWVATQEAVGDPGDPETAHCLLGLFFTPGRVEGR